MVGSCVFPSMGLWIVKRSHLRGRLNAQHSSSMSAPKIKLDAYEMMVMLGNFEPRLSEKAKTVLDRWMEKIPREGLDFATHYQRVIWAAATHEPEGFDMSNRDDRAMVKLSPIAFREDGSRVEDFGDKVEIPDSKFHTVFKNGMAYIEYTALDDAGKPHKVMFAAPLKKKGKGGKRA